MAVLTTRQETADGVETLGEVMAKRIYVEPSWRMHTGVKTQFLHPPEGYEFAFKETRAEATSKRLISLGFPYLVHQALNRFIPPILLQSYLQGFGHRPPETCLTYALYHLVFRKEPWVMELENAATLSESNTGFLKRHRRFFERKLASADCKKIVVWSDPCRRSLDLNLDSSSFAHKVVKVPVAVPPKKDLAEKQGADTVTLFFSNSANVMSNFRVKGGVEVLESFAILSDAYPCLRLVVRSDLPLDVKKRYEGMKNVRFIEETPTREQLDREYRSADILLAPGYMMAVFSVLDGMSYGLPVVATEIACAGEYAEHGKTGLMIPDSRKSPGYDEGFLLPSQPALRARVTAVDPVVVQNLVKAVSVLVDNPEKRRQMGMAGRWEVEHGRFSFQTRNARLKAVLDEATEDSERNGR